MPLKNEVACPKCSNVFDITDVLSAELEKTIRSEYDSKLITEKNKIVAKTRLEVENNFSLEMKEFYSSFNSFGTIIRSFRNNHYLNT